MIKQIKVTSKPTGIKSKKVELSHSVKKTLKLPSSAKNNQPGFMTSKTDKHKREVEQQNMGFSSRLQDMQ